MEKDKDIKELALKAVVNMAKCDSIILPLNAKSEGHNIICSILKEI